MNSHDYIPTPGLRWYITPRHLSGIRNDYGRHDSMWHYRHGHGWWRPLVYLNRRPQHAYGYTLDGTVRPGILASKGHWFRYIAERAALGQGLVGEWELIS